MKVNMNKLERVARIALGAGLISSIYSGMSGPWAWIGVVPIATGLVGICPIYKLLKVNTNGERR